MVSEYLEKCFQAQKKRTLVDLAFYRKISSKMHSIIDGEAKLRIESQNFHINEKMLSLSWQLSCIHSSK